LLSENLVSALLQASITGAGLVLAVYSLILPLTRRIFEERSARFLKYLGELKKSAKKLDIKSSKGEVENIERLGANIRQAQKFPKYLSVGMVVVFLGYLLSSFLSILWFVSIYRDQLDSCLPIIFGITTSAFLLVGLISIRDAYSSLKKEFNATLAQANAVSS